MEDVEVIVMCVRVEDADPRYVVPGCIKENCDLCGKLVYVAPATRLSVPDGFDKACNQCCVQHRLLEEGVYVTPEIMAEARDFHRSLDAQ